MILAKIIVLIFVLNGAEAQKSSCCKYPVGGIVHYINVSSYDFQCDEPLTIKCVNTNTTAAKVVGISAWTPFEIHQEFIAENPIEVTKIMTWTQGNSRLWKIEGYADNYEGIACVYKPRDDWTLYKKWFQ